MTALRIRMGKSKIADQLENSPFTVNNNNQKIITLNPLTSGFCLKRERGQLAFIPGSNDSAVVMAVYRLRLRLAVTET